MFGAKHSSTQAPKLNHVQVQTSAYGAVEAVGWGTFRVSPNLLWYGAFTSHQQQSTSSAGGKGGGGSTTQTSYTYTASAILGLHLGAIDGVSTIWKDKASYTDGGTTALQQAGLSLATGTLGQAVWGYLTTNFPSQALGYSDLAYLYAQDYSLSSSASLANHSAEVYRQRATVSGSPVADADPSVIIPDFLQSTIYGVPNWPANAIGSLTLYQSYCFAAGLLLSPLIDSQRSGRDFLSEILQATNSDAFWSGGQLQITPYGDTSITANGYTYTPILTAIYDLTADDLIPPAEGEEPVKRQVKRPADCYNSIQVEIQNRANAYNTSVTPYIDQAMTDQFGVIKNPSPYSLHCIKTQAASDAIGPLLLQRSAYVRRTFTFTLPWNYGLLDPMDIVTLSFGNLSQQGIRITGYKEKPDGSIDFTAEEMLVGVGHAPAYTRQSPNGYIPNDGSSPGDVSTPFFYAAPGVLTNGDLEVWIAVAGTNANWGGYEVWISLDNSAYERFGTFTNGSRYGVLTSTLASHADPDTTGTCGVDLSTSNGALTTATQSQADGYATLCLIDSELVAYRDASVTSAYHYTLTYFHRGLYGTTPASHSAGAEFIRLDNAIFKYPFTKDRIGQTVYFKFLSFNTHGLQKEALSAATAYSWTLGATVPTPAAGAWSVTGSSFVGSGQSPAIIIDGACADTLNVSKIIIDYKQRTSVGPPAVYGPVASKEFPVTATRLVVDGVIDNAYYDVQVRYRSTQNVEQTSAAVDLGVVQVGSIQITNQGTLATLNNIEDAQLAAGVGVNCLVDTQFTQGSEWWRPDGDSTVTGSYPVSANGVTWAKVLNVGGAVGQQVRLGGDNQVNSLPIAPGEYIEVQAVVGQASCSQVQILARWLDATGHNIGGVPQSSVLQTVTSPGAGLGEIDSGTRVGGFAQAPAGAYRVMFWVIGTISGSGAYIAVTQPMLAKAKSGSTTLSQFNQGFLGEPGATVGAKAGTNLKDSGGTVLGDTDVKNSAISVDASGKIQNIGSGVGTVVDNTKISISAAGALAGAGGGTVTIGGLGYSGDLNATYGARAGTNLKDSGGTTLGDNDVKNIAITLNSNGALSGAGGGAATLTGMGATGWATLANYGWSYNQNVGFSAYRNVDAPLSATSTSITVASHSFNYPGLSGSPITGSTGGGTITGLSASTFYSVYVNASTGALAAATGSGIEPYQASNTTWIFLGSQSTPSGGGTYPTYTVPSGTGGAKSNWNPNVNYA